MAELVRNSAVALIMFVALALAKMDCQRLANYFLLPVLLGSASWIQGAHRRVFATRSPSGRQLSASGATEPPVGTTSPVTSTRLEMGDLLVINDEMTLIDSIEMALGVGFGALTLLHLMCNLLDRVSSPAHNGPIFGNCPKRQDGGVS